MAVGGNLTTALPHCVRHTKNEEANLFDDMAELVDVDPELNTTTKLVGLLASYGLCGLLEKGYRMIYMDN